MFFLLLVSGFIIGGLSGFLGVGGGIIIVPLLLFLGNSPIHAVGTSALAILIISSSATFHNWRQGFLEHKQLTILSIPCIAATQGGVYIASRLPPFLLLLLFGFFLLAAIVLVRWRTKTNEAESPQRLSHRQVGSLVWVGGLGGVLAGMFGVGGGVVLVPLQVLVLKCSLKAAVRTSLGVVMIGSLFSTLGHYVAGNIVMSQGLLLGAGGLLGAQAGVRLLPRLKEPTIIKSFVLLLFLLTAYVFWQAYQLL